MNIQIPESVSKEADELTSIVIRQASGPSPKASVWNRCVEAIMRVQKRAWDATDAKWQEILSPVQLENDALRAQVADFREIIKTAVREQRDLEHQLERVRGVLGEWYNLTRRFLDSPGESYDEAASEFYRDTGLMAPGKSAPMAMGGQNECRDEWKKWNDAKLDDRMRRTKEALAATGSQSRSGGKGEKMSKPQDVLEIVQAHLKQHGYHGLWSNAGGCACLADDLAPCGQIHGCCEPGFRIDYPNQECGGGECGGGCDWHIGTKDVAEAQDRSGGEG